MQQVGSGAFDPSSVRVIASSDNWIESDAVDQLKKMAELPGMIAAVGMPDLHPGKGAPIGAIFASQFIVYPYLVGNDIGCGMSLWKTDSKSHKMKLDRWTKSLCAMEGFWDGDTSAWLEARGVAVTAYDSALGTVGGGNHFAELQRLEQRLCAVDQFLEVDDDYLYLLVHSGSRGLGESILRAVSHSNTRSEED
jgi:release factor H-coupled RctB family protein